MKIVHEVHSKKNSGVPVPEKLRTHFSPDIQDRSRERTGKRLVSPHYLWPEIE